MGESFKKLLWQNKKYSGIFKTLLEVLVFFTPLLVPLIIDREWFFRNAGEWADVLAVVLSVVFVVFIVVSCLQKYVWENRKYEHYMPIVNEQIECICEDKYRALCREMDNGQRYEQGEILLYDAHNTIRSILLYIKQERLDDLLFERILCCSCRADADVFSLAEEAVQQLGCRDD